MAIFLGVIYGLSSLAESKGKTRGAHKLEHALGGAALLVSSFLLQLGIRDAGPIGATEDILVVGIPSAGGFARQARLAYGMGARSFLGNYHLFIDRSRDYLGGKLHIGHINTHPPGNILYFWHITRALDSLTALEKLAQRLAPPASDRALAIVGPTWQVPFWFTESLPELQALPRKLPADTAGNETEAYYTANDALTVPLSTAEGAGLWMGALGLRLAGAIAVLLTYLLCIKLYDTRRAVWAAALMGVSPGLLLFNPSLDVLYACWGILTFGIIYTVGKSKSSPQALLAGLVIYIGLLFTLAMLVPMVCAVGVLFIGWLQRKELRKQLANRRLWTAVAWAAGGFLALLLLLRIVAGYRSFEVWRVCYKMNRLFNQASGRTPWKWALYNPADFLIFLGIPTAVLGFWALASGIRKMSSWQKIKQTSPLAPVLLACIMVLNFSGSNLGEVGRLWLFLMPLVTLSCVGMLGRFCLSARKVVLIAVALQILQTLIFRIYLNLMLII